MNLPAPIANEAFETDTPDKRNDASETDTSTGGFICYQAPSRDAAKHHHHAERSQITRARRTIRIRHVMRRNAFTARNTFHPGRCACHRRGISFFKCFHIPADFVSNCRGIPAGLMHAIAGDISRMFPLRLTLSGCRHGRSAKSKGKSCPGLTPTSRMTMCMSHRGSRPQLIVCILRQVIMHRWRNKDCSHRSGPV